MVVEYHITVRGECLKWIHLSSFPFFPLSATLPKRKENGFCISKKENKLIWHYETILSIRILKWKTICIMEYSIFSEMLAMSVMLLGWQTHLLTSWGPENTSSEMCQEYITSQMSEAYQSFSELLETCTFSQQEEQSQPAEKPEPSCHSFEMLQTRISSPTLDVTQYYQSSVQLNPYGHSGEM